MERGSNSEGKRTLKIDMDELCSAMDDSSYEHYYYLDLQTGEIVFISDYMDEDVLAHYPDERERWFRFKDDRMKERALEWLESIAISPCEG